MVDSIKADVDGLFALGTVCKQLAEALSIDHATQRCGPSFQATAAATDGVAMMADRADNLICMRMRVTGHAIVDAGSRLAECDNASRERIVADADGRKVL